MQKSHCQELPYDSSRSIANSGYLADLNTSVVFEMNLICRIQVIEALKTVPCNQKVEVAASAPSSPIKNLISIPGSKEA